MGASGKFDANAALQEALASVRSVLSAAQEEADKNPLNLRVELENSLDRTGKSAGSVPPIPPSTSQRLAEEAAQNNSPTGGGGSSKRVADLLDEIESLARAIGAARKKIEDGKDDDGHLGLDVAAKRRRIDRLSSEAGELIGGSGATEAGKKEAEEALKRVSSAAKEGTPPTTPQPGGMFDGVNPIAFGQDPIGYGKQFIMKQLYKAVPEGLWGSASGAMSGAPLGVLGLGAAAFGAGVAGGNYINQKALHAVQEDAPFEGDIFSSSGALGVNLYNALRDTESSSRWSSRKDILLDTFMRSSHAAGVGLKGWRGDAVDLMGSLDYDLLGSGISPDQGSAYFGAMIRGGGIGRSNDEVKELLTQIVGHTAKAADAGIMSTERLGDVSRGMQMVAQASNGNVSLAAQRDLMRFAQGFDRSGIASYSHDVAGWTGRMAGNTSDPRNMALSYSQFLGADGMLTDWAMEYVQGDQQLNAMMAGDIARGRDPRAVHSEMAALLTKNPVAATQAMTRVSRGMGARGLGAFARGQILGRDARDIYQSDSADLTGAVKMDGTPLQGEGRTEAKDNLARAIDEQSKTLSGINKSWAAGVAQLNTKIGELASAITKLTRSH